MRTILLSIFWMIISSFMFAQKNNYAQYVNPFIGTGGHGHTFPGATLPYGMVQLSPDTRIDGSWDGCSGYHYSDDFIYGFSHTHLNGTGVSDYGDIMLMPTFNQKGFNQADYGSKFSHKNEKATAGYYQVLLDKYNINVRLTTTTRVGLHEYTFNKAGDANIILDLNHRDKLVDGEVKIVDAKTLYVYRNSEEWAKNQKIFAKIEFNVPLKLTSSKDGNIESKTFKGNEIALAFGKKVKKGEKILLKVTLSTTGYNGTDVNSKELTTFDFSKTKAAAEKTWNKELSKIEVKSSEKNKLTIFYTAMYHTMMQPNISQDLNGDYRGMDDQIHLANNFDYYSVFSLWDTFRAAHPLYTLIEKRRTIDFINTFIKHYEQGGRLPVWELASNETDCMIGYHSVSVIADAMVKVFKGFDYEKAYEAAKHSAMLDHLGLKAYKQNGFISIDDEHESVSKTLEYAYDDWCIAQMALILNKQDDYNYFIERSQYWKNLFNHETKFIQPKKNGGWLKPFDPREVNNNYTEANGWQYTFFAPQDINGMINIYGGKDGFEAKLDELFNAPSETTGREQVDVTGLIGQYAQGNEPSHHVAFLYNYIDKPEKTKELVHKILDEHYKNSPDGLIGNEDCGQMSAWYVLASMGIYSVTPGSGMWTTVEPYFDEITINLEDGTKRVITKNNYKENQFLGFEFLKDREIKTISESEKIVTVPVLVAEDRSFQNKMNVEVKSSEPNAKIYVSVNGKKAEIYKKPISIKETTTISSFIEVNGKKSKTISGTFTKKPNDYTIQLNSTYTPQYHAGGPQGLLDGIVGDSNWKKGDWQGYYDQNFEAIIDMKKAKSVSSVVMNFLQDSRSWIVLPTKLEVYTSQDNQNFKLVGMLEKQVDAFDNNIFSDQWKVQFKAEKARYIKVKATNYGAFPKGHLAEPFQGKSYIFVDEITIK
ncbi:GH92 family glycosyl hydrolase [Empedobacter tilapiae]|uniref:Alpha-mannosidase n=1 Tax=Empedobacter tilapiae TaxID=2491114 RepID=A0A4Z1BWB9_9FLAO|nr:GH92 family glycosyl hydrolase [Empedobacter tilapiae]TGN29239.1 alpha-mannosidase [Empedobacter tilapiae]